MSDNAVDAAYAALVSEIASCAKEVKSCVESAADDAAVDACREQFAGCRQDAGKKNVDALAGAARSCAATHKECVKSAPRGEAGGCQEEQRQCLRAARTEEDDEDAGAEHAGNGGRKAARADCLDELHPCVEADGPANVCAENVRMCLVDSVPSPVAVVPEMDSDEDATGQGSGRGKSGSAKAADAADAGAQDKGTASAARACVDTLHTCIDAGNPARGCAKALKACRATATP